MQKTKNQQTAVIYARARGASRAQEDEALEARSADAINGSKATDTP